MIEQPSSQKYMNGVPYAAQSQYKELPNENQSINGVIPLDTCPASWWNGLWNFVTEQEIKITEDMDVIIKEIVAVIERAGIIDVTAQNTLSRAIVTLAQTIATTNVPGAVISSSDDGAVAVDNTGKMTLNGYNDLISGIGDLSDLDTTTKSSIVLAINEIIGLKGQPNGVATLDADGRIPYSQLPESAVEYKGEWNASINTPTLVDGTGTTGDMYYVSTDGTQNLGSGAITFLAGDRIIYNGTVWQKLPSGSVKSVNNIRPDDTGNVTIEIEDVNVENFLYYTYVIDSNQKLLDWANNVAGNDYSSVLIKKGTWTSSVGVNLTTCGTKVVVGEVGSLLDITSNQGLFYDEVPTSSEYYMVNVNVKVNFYNSRNFYNCTNLTNCNSSGSGSTSNDFYNCTNLTNCTVTDASDHGFHNCTNLTNCTVTDSRIGFYNCTNLTNCTGTGSAYGFYDCTNLTNCTGTGKFGFYSCRGVSRCKAGGPCENMVFNPSSYASQSSNSTYTCADTPEGGFNDTTNPSS